MADINKTIKVGIEYESNHQTIEAAKRALEEVQKTAQKMEMSGNLTDELKEAAEAAKKLNSILIQSYNNKIGQIDLTKFNNEIKTAYGNVDTLKKKMEQGGTVASNAFNRVAQSVVTTNIQLTKSNELLNKFAITFANTVRYGISSSVFNNFTNSISKAYSYVQNLDKSLNDIRIVSNATASDMERFAKYANGAAKSLGASTLDYTKGALIYYQQGLDEEEVKKRTDITLKMSNVLGTSAQEVSDYMTAI